MHTNALPAQATRWRLRGFPGATAVRRALIAVLAGGLAVETVGVLATPSASEVSQFVVSRVALVAYVAGAALCALRASSPGPGRLAWVLLASAAWVWVAGNVTWAVFFASLASPPVPSIADGFFLSVVPLAVGGLVCLVRANQRGARLRGAVLLDAIIVSLTVAAAAEIAVVGPTLGRLGGSFATVATSAAYPLGDLLMAITIAIVLTMHRGRPPRAIAWLGVAMVTFTVADSLFAIRVANGSYVSGSTYELLWSYAFAMIAVASLQRSGSEPLAGTHKAAPMLIAPMFASVAVGLLILGTARPISVFAVVAATAAIVASLARISLSMGDLRALAQARHEASTDDLTGLANRRGFYRTLEAQVQRARQDDGSFGVLLIDLDNFKAFNDTLGHSVGDVLLGQAGRRISTALGVRTQAARMGGDEFAVVVEGGRPADEAARRITEGLSEPFVIDGTPFVVGASIGISLFPGDGTTSETLVRHADLAMYEAKRSLTPFQFYEPTRDDLSLRRFALMNELPRAIEQGELTLHYQPKLDLVTGEIVGLEALVRWRHPDHGLLAPADFLSVAEQFGLMRPLTAWVLRTALLETAATGLRVAVNASASCLLDPGFTDEVSAIVDELGFTGKALTIEITEDVLMTDAARARSAIAALAATGIEIALDDFGTGYSSLSYLHELEVDEIKIDRSFIARMERDGSTVIVRSLIDLAGNLGIRVVAEGVETITSIEKLRQLGCDVAQGNLISPPLPEAEMRDWMRGYRPSVRVAGATLLG